MTDKNELMDLFERAYRLGAMRAPDGLPNNLGISRFLVPDGMRMHIETDPLHLGDHVSTKATFLDPHTLVEYINTYKDLDGSTVVFADAKSGLISAVMNYHTVDKPAHCDHIISFDPDYDPTYKIWSEISGKWQTQVEFAHFLEEHAQDIHTPDSAHIVEIATSLEIKTEIDFKSARNLQSGAVELNYLERNESRTRGSLEIPKAITVQAPVFFGGDPMEIILFLRYNAKDGNLKFKVDMHRREYIEDDAFTAIVNQIVEKTSVPLYKGMLVKSA
jgi:uncharacterized protein YfdQ (DUF2303 family)